MADLGPWAGLTPAEAAELLSGFDRPWWVAGGWALEAATGVRRPHADLDVGIFRTDADRLRAALPDHTCWSAYDGRLTPFTDAHPLLPEANNLWVRRDASSPWLLDVLPTPGDTGGWVNRRQPRMTLPLEEVTWVGDGIRHLAPEVVLLFKARHQRTHDEADLAAALPVLTPGARAWLREALSQIHPGHPWIEVIA